MTQPAVSPALSDKAVVFATGDGGFQDAPALIQVRARCSSEISPWSSTSPRG